MSMIFEFIEWNKSQLNSILSKREGEVKIGEKITDLRGAKYVILGVEESIGPRANFGRAGAENGFSTFLNFFLNMQSNESLIGDNIHVLGKIVCANGVEDDLRSKVAELDDFIVETLEKHLSSGQIPILIGGGHNNAYPLIKFNSKRLGHKIDVINLDAHADYRALEGRHSGNSFSYAFNEGFINRYYAVGLHQRYNSQRILDDLRQDNHYFTFHESYLMEEKSYKEDFEKLLNQFNEQNSHIGVELDLDTISYMPSSAFSPVGISIDIARLYIRTMARLNHVSYLHLPEGAPSNDIENRIVGKTLAYLVSDFISINE